MYDDDEDDALPLPAPERELLTGDEKLPIADRVALGIARGHHRGGGIVPFPAHLHGRAALNALTGTERKSRDWFLAHGFKPTVYDTCDADGRLLMQVVRYDHPTEPKEVRPLRYCGKGSDGLALFWFSWIPGTKPLNGLDALAARPAAPVLVVEGEKAATAARAMLPDYVVVCWPSGAAGVANTDVAALAARDLRLWPDNDAPGRRYMRMFAARALTAGAASAAIVDVPGDFAKGWDLADPLPDGVTGATIAQLLATARPLDRARAVALLRDPRRAAATRRLLGYAPGYSRVPPEVVADALALLDPDMGGGEWPPLSGAASYTTSWGTTGARPRRGRSWRAGHA